MLRKIIYTAISILGVATIGTIVQPKLTQASNINNPKPEEQQQPQSKKQKS